MTRHLLGLGARLKYVVSAIVTVFVLDQLGLFQRIMERDYETEFNYPLDVNGRRLLWQLNQGQEPEYKPINSYEQYRFKIRNTCSGAAPRLVLLVKSALKNRERRNAIRRTWGYEGRFSDVALRRVFLLGSSDDTQDAIDSEHALHGDLVQADFIDAYYNNTIKTMIGFRWLYYHCPQAQFAMFVDDDYYVSVKNLLRFLGNPLQLSPAEDRAPESRVPDGRLYAGYVFPSSRPMRHRFSKWYLSLEEYPFSRFPPYVTAGAFVLSAPALRDMYRMSKYTKHFRFDDIYLAIVAYKAGVVPLHNDRFRFWEQHGEMDAGVVAAHGFGDPALLARVWERQKMRGEA